MKNFLAVYTGTKDSHAETGWDRLSEAEQAERRAAGMQAWMEWGKRNADRIVDGGGPLGTTKLANRQGLSDSKNHLVAYVIVRAQSHAEAAKLFEGHPHFSIFPGDGVEIMECLPLPGASG
ncbi:MAG: hypothetical protein H6718_12070 [Polyangiaceae bacterium]|nr:hypothetical protein [Myxococcales bacterium]MCB9586129.1 hypothetical protein [Polyangiaceae bacterium]MCB9606807.1 hypothetical protein [Polyangiaceae bacterium]